MWLRRGGAPDAKRHRSTTKEHIMKRLTPLLAAALLATAVMAAPALADQPVDFTLESTLYGEPDPCNPGEPMDVSFTFDVYQPVDRNTLVWVVDSYMESTSGYVGNAAEAQVVNGNWLIDRFNWQLRNAETGDKALVQGRTTIDLESGDATMLEFRMVCLGSSG